MFIDQNVVDLRPNSNTFDDSFIGVTVAYDMTCLLYSYGDTHCVGRNDFGQLGRGMVYILPQETHVAKIRLLLFSSSVVYPASNPSTIFSVISKLMYLQATC